MASINPMDVRSRFDDLDREVAAVKIAANEIKTAVNNLGAAVNAIPAGIAGSTQVKEAIKEAVERSNIGSNVSDAKAAAEATKTAVDNILRDITLPHDVVQALKEEIRNTVRSEIAAQGIDDSAIRAAVSDMRLATDTLKTNAGAFNVNEILNALKELDKRIAGIERTSRFGAFVPNEDKKALKDAYKPYQEVDALPF